MITSIKPNIHNRESVPISVNNTFLNGNNIKCLNNALPYYKQDTYFFSNQVISFGSKKDNFLAMLKGRYHYSDAQAKFIIKNQIDECKNISPENFDSDVADCFIELLSI